MHARHAFTSGDKITVRSPTPTIVCDASILRACLVMQFVKHLIDKLIDSRLCAAISHIYSRASTNRHQYRNFHEEWSYILGGSIKWVSPVRALINCISNEFLQVFIAFELVLRANAVRLKFHSFGANGTPTDPGFETVANLFQNLIYMQILFPSQISSNISRRSSAPMMTQFS